MIAERYRYQLFIDDLPNATMEKNEEGKLEPSYKEGLYVGKKYEDNSYIIYNHLDIVVRTHEVSAGDEVRIVGFAVTPRSIKSGSAGTGNHGSAPEQYIKLANGEYDDMDDGLIFSYTISTVNDETTDWSHRMDHYYIIGKYDVHMK